MMIAFVLAAAMVAPSADTAIDLNNRDTTTLINGLERELGGKFLLTGLANAGKVCDRTRACIVPSAVRSQAVNDPRLQRSTDVSSLLSATRIGGIRPIYAVAIRSVRGAGGKMHITASIFDASQQRWRLATAYIRDTPAVVAQPITIYTRTFQSFRYVSS